MTLQDLAAIAAVVELAVVACACAAGFLLARGLRLPGWATAAAMLLIIRSIAMAAIHAWDTPSSAGSFPVVDVSVGAAAFAMLVREHWLARAARLEPVATIAGAPPAPEAHADAA